MNTEFQIELAQKRHVSKIKHLMNLSIMQLQRGFLSTQQIQASHMAMGLDSQLIEDQTYICIFDKAGRELVGCGGWSLRATLYGGNHSKGRSAAMLDPNSDPARIRAMYTHPDWARRGIGSLIINHCEAEIIAAGFTSATMMATLSGVPLYKKCGYHEIEPHEDTAPDGTIVPFIRMGKDLVVSN